MSTFLTALNGRMVPRFVASFGLVVIGFSFVVPRPARAQGAFDMGMLTNTISQDAVTQSERKRSRRMRSSDSSLKSALSRSMKGNSGKTTQAAFTPSPTIRKKSIARFLSTVRAADPQAAASLEKDFNSRDIFGTLTQKLAMYGLKTNSVTDAFTVYTIVAWQGVRGNNDDPSKAQVRGVREQMGHVLAGVPLLASASDARKQELADAFLLQALLIDSCIAGAKKRPDQMPQVKASLAMGTQATLGFDLTTFKLTDKGLVL